MGLPCCSRNRTDSPACSAPGNEKSTFGPRFRGGVTASLAWLRLRGRRRGTSGFVEHAAPAVITLRPAPNDVAAMPPGAARDRRSARQPHRWCRARG